MSRYSKPHTHAPLIDPATDPRTAVCIKVAAAYLGMDHRTLRKRINLGKLAMWRDGSVCRINIADLVAYDEERKRKPVAA